MRLLLVRVRGFAPYSELTLEPGAGLVGVVGGDSFVRRQLWMHIGEAVRAGGRMAMDDGGEILVDTVPASRPSATLDATVSLWSGRGLDSLEAAAGAAVRVLGDGGAPDESGPQPPTFEGHRVAEAEVRRLRADHAEVAGDLEVASMEWLRERQDAETQLQAYRDRARELKARLSELESGGPDAACPTCGRVLDSHHGAVLDYLREEWETVVQDGSWWKRRREQLELKPAHVQELEGRSLRLQAAIEDETERVERERARAERTGSTLTTAEPGVRTLLFERAGELMSRASGGRILGIRMEDDALVLDGMEGLLHPVTEEDRAVGLLSLRVAAALARSERLDGSAGGLMLYEPFAAMSHEVARRMLEALGERQRQLGQVILFEAGASIDAQPELFDNVFHLERAGRPGGWRLQRLAAGVGALRISRGA